MRRPVRVLIVAGELSGDMHAAGLVRALRRRLDAMECYGIGGDALQREGVEIIRHARDMAVMGFLELIPKLAFFRRAFRDLLRLAAERRPDVVLLVDYPGFNLRFAARAHAMGLKVVYFICPQVWAWHRSRMTAMARNVDRLISILSFEPAEFEGTGLAVDYVGHPLVDDMRRAREEPLPELPWGGGPRVAVLPGSRAQVVRRMLPVFLRTADAFARRRPGATFLIASASPEMT